MKRFLIYSMLSLLVNPADAFSDIRKLSLNEMNAAKETQHICAGYCHYIVLLEKGWKDFYPYTSGLGYSMDEAYAQLRNTCHSFCDIDPRNRGCKAYQWRCN